MAQIQSNGASPAAEARAKPVTLASMFNPDEAAELKRRILEDGGRMFAEALQRETVERPKIVFDDKGKLVPADFDSLFRIARWIASMQLYGVRNKEGFRPYTVEECAAIIAAIAVGLVEAQEAALAESGGAALLLDLFDHPLAGGRRQCGNDVGTRLAGDQHPAILQHRQPRDIGPRVGQWHLQPLGHLSFGVAYRPLL